MVTFQQRAQPRKYMKSEYSAGKLIYCVYPGNFPMAVRNALALRLDSEGKQIWEITAPITDNIPFIDLVWKPVGFCRSHGYDRMMRRCFMQPERPFAHCHFENIRVLTTKSGLVKSLKAYYESSEQFKAANHTFD